MAFDAVTLQHLEDALSEAFPYSPEAITGMIGKGALKFVCLDGEQLMRALSSDDGLTILLERLWRHADETGEAYLPASRL